MVTLHLTEQQVSSLLTILCCSDLVITKPSKKTSAKYSNDVTELHAYILEAFRNRNNSTDATHLLSLGPFILSNIDVTCFAKDPPDKQLPVSTFKADFTSIRDGSVASCSFAVQNIHDSHIGYAC